jgi:DNA-directed RNA polymerase beta subunit
METNAFVSHGVAAVANDRLHVSSDKYTTYVCNTCGTFAEPPAPKRVHSVTHATAYCRLCDSHDNIHLLELPYACKLFFQEMMALHIMPKIEL